MTDKQKIREFTKEVDQILWKEWDPIGINDALATKDEYTSYANTICGKLWNGENKDALLEYLFWAVNKNMGLTGSKENIDRENIKIIDKIINIFSKYKN